jgi:hypothetical protein
MPLPPRAAPFLERLRRFMRGESMDAFRAAAAAAFAGEGRDVAAEDRELLDDYTLFAHRDAGGRTGIDLFLAARGGGLPAEERAAYERMRASVFGGFQVEQVRPGEGFTLRLCGTGERYAVLDAAASRDAAPRACVFTRLIPYRSHFEIAGPALMYAESFAYSLERAAKRAKESARASPLDPRAVYSLVRRSRAKEPRPENPLEAELYASRVFAEFKLPFTVEEIQRRLATTESPADLLARLKTPEFRNEEEAACFAAAVAALWNHTPRADLVGRTPREKQEDDLAAGRGGLPEHLRADLAHHIAERIDPSRFRSRRVLEEATEAEVARWYETPQEELGGLTPADVEEGRVRVVLPDRAALPERDRPVWTEARLREKAEACLRAGRDRGLVWALHAMARRGLPLPDGALAAALAPDEEGARIGVFLDEFPREAPAAAAAQVVAAVVQRLGDYEGGHGYCVALRFLAWAAPREHHALFEEALRSEFECVYEAGVFGLGETRAAEAAPRLLEVLHSTADFPLASRALAGLILAGAGEAVAEGSEKLVDICLGARDGLTEAGEGEAHDLAELCVELERAGIDEDLWRRVEIALLDPETDAEAPPVRADRFAVFLPAADPAAARRGAAVLTAERRRRIARFADQGNSARLAAILADAAAEALARAAADNPEFRPLGAALAAFVAATSSQKMLRSLHPHDQESLALLYGTILAKAVRGRDAEKELARAEGDAAALAALLRLDEPWIPPALLPQLAAEAPEEDLMALAASPDAHVSANSRLLLAVKTPARGLAGLVACIDEAGATQACLEFAARAGGDRVLDAWLESFARHRSGASVNDLAMLIAALATERAGAYAAHFFDLLVRETRPEAVSAALLAAGNRDLATRMIDAFRRGEARCGALADDEFFRDAARGGLAALIEVFGLRADPEEVFDEGLRKYLAAHPEDAVAEEDEEPEEDDDEGAEAEDGGDDRFTDLALPADPFGAEGGEFAFQQEPRPSETAPKPGRNDPCPCGSGRKYKRCCGR